MKQNNAMMIGSLISMHFQQLEDLKFQTVPAWHIYLVPVLEVSLHPRKHEGTERDTEGVGCDMS